MVGPVTIAALIAVLFVAWRLYHRFSADRIGAIVERRRADSRMVSRGTFIQEGEHRPVALALTGSAFVYQGTDVDASLDLQWIRDVEYDTKLASGETVRGKVLRLLCYGRIFEFVLPDEFVPRWHMMLPPHRGTKTASPQVSPDVQVAV